MLALQQQSNYQFQYIIGIRCSQAEAWELLVRVPTWHKWDTELKEATLFNDFGLGARGELVPKTGPRLKFEITEYVPWHSYTFKTKLPIGYLEITRTLAAKEDLVYFTDKIRFTGFLKRFFGAVLGKGFKAVLPAVMQNFKELLEKDNLQ